MVAAATDYFTEVGDPGTATTLVAPGHLIGGTSITVVSTANYPTDTGVIFAIDTVTLVNGEEVRDAGSYTEWEATVAGATSITNMALRYGADQNYPAGATTRVYIPVASSRENRLVNGIIVQHKQTGAHADTITTNIINENTAAAGVTIDGVKLKDSIPYCDTIAEKTAAAGVTADGVLLKDGAVTATGTVKSSIGFLPDANDGAYLGQAGTAFSDLFLAEGGVINWDSGDATLTQAGDVVTLAGAVLKTSTPGTASTSVATIDGTQTLTNKTINCNANTITNPYMFRVYRNAALSGITDATITVVNFDTESFDPNSNFNLTTDQYTIPVTGYYHFDFSARLNGTAMVGAAGYIYGGATGNTLLSSNIRAQASASDAHVINTGLFYCTAGDLINARIYADVTGTVTVTEGSASTYFSGFFVSE